MRSKIAAMEMSVGTIVTIVLLMSVLVLGIFLIRNIFGGSKDAIDSVNSQVQSEINKLFAEEGKKLVVYPTSREISLKQGKSGGFGFSVRNTNQGGDVVNYIYTVTASQENLDKCGLSEKQANDLIELGASDDFELGSGDYLENAILVKYYIPEAAPLCLTRYNLEVDEKESGKPYASITIDLEIK